MNLHKKLYTTADVGTPNVVKGGSLALFAFRKSLLSIKHSQQLFNLAVQPPILLPLA